jgi:hypothetical protein
VSIRTCRDLLAYEYGDELVCTFHELDYTVGTAVVQIARGSGKRIWITITNWGAAAIAVSTKPDVTATTGMIVAPNGFLNLHWRNDSDLSTAQLYAISSGAGNAVHVSEQVLIA